MPLTKRALLVASTGLLALTACTSSVMPTPDASPAVAPTADASTPDTSMPDASPDTSLADGSAVMLGFAPSNIAVASLLLDAGKPGDLDVSGADCTFNTERGTVACGQYVPFAYAQVHQTGGSTLGMFVFNSLTVEPQGQLSVNGNMPLVIVALDQVTLNGQLLAHATAGLTVAGGATSGLGGQSGAGLGGGSQGVDPFGGAGAGFCGHGGSGGGPGDAGTPPAGGAPYGNSALVPLFGGSQGGPGANGAATGGGGGGAVQIVAANSISIGQGGVINVGGGGGRTNTGVNASGGGSGGAILLEAPTVTVAGVLAANGGGGGGSGTPGQDGQESSTKAAGSSTGGGNGSAADMADGQPAGATAKQSGGAGGAGWIRINTRSGAMLTGVLSPSKASMCATEGMLKP